MGDAKQLLHFHAPDISHPSKNQLVGIWPSAYDSGMNGDSGEHDARKNVGELIRELVPVILTGVLDGVVDAKAQGLACSAPTRVDFTVDVDAFVCRARFEVALG
jgi:hypothetical protein